MVKPHIVIIENNLIATLTIRQRLTLELMKEFDITVLSTGNSAQFKAAKDLGITAINVGRSNQNIIGIYKYLRNLRKALRSIHPVLCLTFTIRPAIWGNFITHRLRIPTITNITGIGPLFTRNDPAYRFARAVYKYMLKHTRIVFFQNNDDRDIFLSHNFIKPQVARQIPGSGIDPDYYYPREKTHPGPFTFLFISRLVKDKGILEYVEAAKKIRGERNAIRFRVLGPVWSQNLKNNTISETDIADWEKEGAVEYLGETHDVRPFIAEADCIVLPSYREGTSNVLLEAAAMEKPSITCDTTGCREIVEDGVTGFLCRVKDVNSLVNSMYKMISLDEKERIEMGKRARTKVSKEFNKNFVIRAYLKEIREIVGSQ